MCRHPNRAERAAKNPAQHPDWERPLPPLQYRVFRTLEQRIRDQCNPDDREEFESFDVEMTSRVSRFLEVLQVARRLWTEDEVTHEGRHFRLDRAVLTLKPLQRPHPPVWIAARGDAALERAAQHGDARLINLHASLPTLERQMALYRPTLAAAERRFPTDAPLLKEFRIADTHRPAVDESRPYLEKKYRASPDWGLDKPMPKEESLSVPFDDLTRDRFILGAPDECRADIERPARVLGVHHFIFRVQWPGMWQADALSQIERLGRHVIAAMPSEDR